MRVDYSMLRAPTEVSPRHHSVDTSQRILIVSYACDPYSSMESRLGWHRAVASAERYPTWVLCDAKHKPQIERYFEENQANPNLSFIFEDHSPFQRKAMRGGGLKYWAYRKWHHRAFKIAEIEHRKHPWTLVHQVGFCGYREPGYCWKIDAPFIWGPVGGTDNVPLAFLGSLGFWGAAMESMRRATNWFHLRFRHRVRAACRKASFVLAANSSARDKLSRIHGIEVERLLETGIESVPPARQGEESVAAGSRPLRMVWSGRFCRWKGFSLLLRALNELPPDFKYQLRVIAYGPQEQQLKAMAKERGVAKHIDWIGWPQWHETFSHYEWADTFVFTSMRDTSGTGLLEALTHGCSIIGVNHQGAKDIMSNDSALPVEVTNPADVAFNIGQAIQRLGNDPALRSSLSEGARCRARDFLWDTQKKRLHEIYETVLGAYCPNHA